MFGECREVLERTRPRRSSAGRLICIASLFIFAAAPAYGGSAIISKPGTAELATGPSADNTESNASPRWSASGGGDLLGTSWFTYGTITFAPFGYITSDGLRIRAGTGSGQYHYDGDIIVAPAIGPGRAPAAERITFNGTTNLAEALIGYQWQFGDWTTKLYVGGQWTDHTIVPDDPLNLINGSQIGFKVVTENWLNGPLDTWAQLDASYAAPFESYAVSGRVGWRALEDIGFIEGVDIGVEASALGNQVFDGKRLGGFLQLRLFGQEIRFSGGTASDYGDSQERYGAINTFRRF